MSYAYSRFTDAYGLYGFSHFFMCLAINTLQDQPDKPKTSRQSQDTQVFKITYSISNI